MELVAVMVDLCGPVHLDREGGVTWKACNLGGKYLFSF